MWQDGLALLLVVIAVLFLLRTYTPAGMFRFGARRGSDGSVKSATPASGCGGCPWGSSCSTVRIKTHPGRYPTARAIPVRRPPTERPNPPVVKPAIHGASRGQGNCAM